MNTTAKTAEKSALIVEPVLGSHEMSRLIDSLQSRFPLTSHSTIETLMNRRYLEFSGARIRAYIPIMVEREVRSDLRGQAAAPSSPLRISAVA